MKSAYAVGYQAYFDGLPMSSNPFEGDDARRWSMGWTEADDDFQDLGFNPGLSNDPFEVGHDDFFRDRPVSRNPWPADSLAGRDWLTGWERAFELAEEIAHDRRELVHS